MSKRGREPEEELAAKRPCQGTEGAQPIGGQALNVNHGTNYGTISQHSAMHYHSHVCHQQPTIDLLDCLKPILDTSHTRNLEKSPPNSSCLEGTRVTFIEKVLSWARSGVHRPEAEAQKSDSLNGRAHILWIYGYAGCGKSAISLAVAKQLAKEGRLAASFFFFRGAGDRSKVLRLIGTIVYQMVAAFPATLPHAREVVANCYWLHSSETADIAAQFTELVLRPILNAAQGTPNFAPVTILLDGVDECEDHSQVGHLIKGVIACFDEYPDAPLRLVIASRVESHLHRLLRNSDKVQLLDLVDHTSDEDIEIAIGARLEEEKRGGILVYQPSWPSKEEKEQLVKHIGGSFIFMTTIFRELFKPFTSDGSTPMNRLPVLLSKAANFDELYLSLLRPLEHAPRFLDILSTIALAERALSIAEIADLVEIDIPIVAAVLLDLHAIMRIPGDDHSPVTLWHTSFRDFLCSKDRRAGSFSAFPVHHGRLAFRCARIANYSKNPKPLAFDYAREHGWSHFGDYLAFEHRTGSPIPEDVTSDLAMANFGYGDALQEACLCFKWEVARTLVVAGANVNIDFFGYLEDFGLKTPLHAACADNETEIVDLFLKHGADPNINGKTRTDDSNEDLDEDWVLTLCPLAWAVRKGDVDLVRKFLQCGADPNILDKDGWTPLHHAAQAELAVTECLLESSANPNNQNRGGSTPLHFACELDDLEMVSLLLYHSVDPNIREKKWVAPLHFACTKGNPDSTELYLCHNADPNVRNTYGNTPLHSMCRKKRTHTLAHVERLLLRHNADPNVKNNVGKTPLHYAYYYGELEVAACLLNYGADPTIRDNEGKTPPQSARRLVEGLWCSYDASGDSQWESFLG